MEHPCPVLPDDVIEDIFTRVPARTALECRGLSRHWAATLSSDAFVERHRRAANSHGGPRFFFFRLSSPKITTAYGWSPACPVGEVGPLPPLTPPVQWMRDGITQQCRGLVVVDVENNNPGRAYCVYNPSTGCMTALPPFRFTTDSPGWQLPSERRYHSIGFGYDASRGKYKVVRIYYRGGQLPVLCDVYVVDDAGGGFWRAPLASFRRLGARKPAAWVSSYEASVFAQGHVHWMAQKQKPERLEHWRVTRDGLIVSFSLADEAFGVVPLPPGVNYLCEYQLTELEGRLCLFTPYVDRKRIDRGRRPYDVWLLRDHETGTWDLRWHIDLDAASPEVFRYLCNRASPVAAMDHGRRILFMSSYEYFSWQPTAAYTPATGTLESLPSGSGLIACHTYTVNERLATLYEESLVSPGRPHEDILFSPAANQAVCIALARHLPPPRDLARLKLVSRSWHAMIESKRFVKLQALSFVRSNQLRRS